MFYFILRRRIYYAKMGPSQEPIRFPALNVFIASTRSSEEVLQAIYQNKDFTTIAYRWCVTMAKSNVLDQAIASLGQTRPIIQTLPALVQQKSDVVLRQNEAPIPLESEIDFLSAKEWLHRREVGKAQAKLGQENGKDDIPETPEVQKEFANELSLAAMNEVGMADLEYHGEGEKKKLNYIVKPKRDLSTLDIAMFGWEASRVLRDSHLGLCNGSSLVSLDLQAYGSFKTRSGTIKNLFNVSNMVTRLMLSHSYLLITLVS